MTGEAGSGVLDEALRRRLLEFADDCARDFKAVAARVTVVATSVGALAKVTDSGSSTDTAKVWAVSVEAGVEPFIHVRLGPAHPRRGLILVLGRSDLQLMQRGVSAEPFDLTPLGPPELLRRNENE